MRAFWKKTPPPVEESNLISLKGKMTNFGTGFNLENLDTPMNILVPDEDRCRGSFIFGTTGSGKTRLAESLIEHDIRNGYSCVFIDPKGDPDALSKMVYLALDTGRKHDFMLVSPIYPHLSAKIDPLASYFMLEELVGHITSGIKIGKEPFFFNTAYETSLVICQALILLARAAGERPTFNLKEVSRHVGRSGLERLKERIDMLEDDPEADELSEAMAQVLETPPDFFSKVGSSLRTCLTELNSGSVGQIIGKAHENRFLKRMEKGQGVIMVVQLGSLLTRRASMTAGKVILSMIQSYVGRVLASGGVVDPPLSIHIDEAQSILYDGFEDFAAKCGSARVMLNMYAQSINQLFDIVGEDKAYSILDNSNTKVNLRVNDAQTAEYVSRHMGDKKVMSHIISFGGGLSSRQGREERVKSDELLRLQKRQFFLQTYSGIYRGKTPDCIDPPIRVKLPKPATTSSLIENGLAGQGEENVA